MSSDEKSLLILMNIKYHMETDPEFKEKLGQFECLCVLTLFEELSEKLGRKK